MLNECTRLLQTHHVPSIKYLSLDDLVRSDSEHPKIVRLRKSLLFIYFTLLPVLLFTAILLIIRADKCPYVPSLKFWQRKIGYWIDPFAFKDYNGDMVGDFQGLIKSIDYLKDILDIGFIILGSFVSGTYSNQHGTIGLTENFMMVDVALGTLDDFKNLIRIFHQHDIEVVVTLDFNAVSVSHPWTKMPSFLQVPANPNMKSRSGDNATIEINGATYYTVNNPETVDLDLLSKHVVFELKNVMKFWLSMDVDGLLLTNTAFFVENAMTYSNPTVEVVLLFS